MRFDQLPEDIQKIVRANTTARVERLSELELWRWLLVDCSDPEVLGRAHLVLFDLPRTKSLLLEAITTRECEAILDRCGRHDDDQLLTVDRILHDRRYSPREALLMIKEVLNEV